MVWCYPMHTCPAICFLKENLYKYEIYIILLVLEQNEFWRGINSEMSNNYSDECGHSLTIRNSIVAIKR